MLQKYFTYITLFFFIITVYTGCNNRREQKNIQQEKPQQEKVISQKSFIGYIESSFTKDGSDFIAVDTVEWLTIEHGKELSGGEQEMPSGYSIKNTVKDSITLMVPDTAKIIMQTFSHNSSGNYNFNEKITVRKFFAILGNKEFERFKHKLYQFKVLNNVIISIQEKYTP